MTHLSLSWRSASSALFPVATAAVAAVIFLVDLLTPPEVVVAGLYVIVILMATRFCRPLGVLLVAIGCIGLAVVAYLLSAETGPNTAIRIVAMMATTFLAVEGQRATAALGESNAQWREVFEHNPVMYFMVSPAGTVLSVNAFGAANLGYTAAELMGESVLTVFLQEDREVVTGQLATCVEELGRSHSWEIRKIRKDGRIIWVRENAKAVRRSANDVIILIACEDITGRRRGEQRVAAEYAVTRILAEANSLAAGAPHLLRAVGENLEWDWGALWSFDREREEAGAPLRCDCLWHAPEIETAQFDAASRERSFRAGEGRVGHVWRTTKPIWMVDATTEPEFLRASAAAQAGLHGGVIFPILLDTEALGIIELFSRAARDQDEQQLATLSAIGSQIGQFIKRQRAEAALRASEERWRAVFENTAVGIATFDFEHRRYQTANEAFQRMTGYSGDELRNLTVVDITPEEDQAAMRMRLDEIVAGPRRSYRVERRYRRKDGEFLWADVNTFFVPATDSTPAFLAVVAVDITERKRAEEALREAEERFRTLVQFSFDVYWESDAQHRFTRQEFAEGLGDAPPPGSEIGKTRWEVPYLEPDAEAWRKHRETLDAHLPFRDFEHARPTPDGGKRYVSVSGLPVFDERGRFIGYRGVGRHITDRKRAEAALRASEERWRAMFEIAPVGIATIDFERRRYLTANQSFQRMTGYTEAELRNLTTLELTHEDDRAAMQERIDSGTVGVLQRKRYRRKNGEVAWADVTSFVVPAIDSTPAFRVSVIVDISDRKRADEALQQAQADLARLNRVMLLGEMTASIAHEVNQPIAATVTNAHAGLRWLGAQPPDLEEARQALGRIVRDGSRAGEVIDRIRALVKKVPPRRELLDVNEAIREVIALTQTEMQQNRVRLQTRLACDLPLVPADRVQLQQVIMNLLVNAVEAMAGVGDGPRELAIASGKDDANAVFVEVQDTGPGIDPADLDRLFQSFYTTKRDGIGMGLGISRSIIEAHGGRLSAAPNQPHGAVFRFTLPAEEKSSEGARSHRVDMVRSIVVRQQGD
jgi:PAS domain S-box-containing protein